MPCSTCRDAGFIPSTPTANIAGLRKALDAGVASLCGCPQGQWWLSSIYAEYGSMLDRNKVEMGNPDFRQMRGVPPGMLHGAAAAAWLEKNYVGTAGATAKTSSLGASASLALAGLMTGPCLLQSVASAMHGPSFSPATMSPSVSHPLALFLALVFGGMILLSLAARAWDALNRRIERMSAVDDAAERQADS